MIKRNENYNIFAAICYMVLFLYRGIAEIRVGFYEWLQIIDWIGVFGILGMAAAHFMKKNKAVVVASGANVIYTVYRFLYFVEDFVEWFAVFGVRYSIFSFFYGLQYLFNTLAYAGVIALVVLKNKREIIIKKAWFIPALLQLISLVFYIIPEIDDPVFEINRVTTYVLFMIVEIVALLFTGMWLRGDTMATESVSEKGYEMLSSKIERNALNYSAIGGADKLKMYSELLKSGAITQEEFEAKKKQTLGL